MTRSRVESDRHPAEGRQMTEGGRETGAGCGAILRLSLTVLILVVLAFPGCGRRSHEGEVRLLFWQFWQEELIAPVLEEFAASHPGVTVELETLTWQSGFEKILMAMAAGTSPDLLELGSTWVPRFASEGALLDVTEEVADLVPELRLWEPVTWEGRRYGIPWLVGTRVLFLNRDLFRRAGLDPDAPPETWEELRRAARAIHSLGPGIYGFGLNAGERYVLYKKYLPFAWGNGGRLIAAEGREVVVNSRENREALEFYLSLREYSLQEKQDVLDRAFMEGRVGIIISGGWNLARIPRDAPALDFSVALMPRPRRGRGTPASFAGGEMLVVPRASAHPAEALALARYLVRAENAALVARGAGSVLPAARGAEVDTTLAVGEAERVFLAQLAWAQSPPAHPQWVAMEDALDGALEEALYGRLTPREALERAHREIEGILFRESAVAAGREEERP